MNAELIPIASLTPHPLNSYYFDDITGDNWEDFLQSIKTSGVTNAITIDNNNVIISGHQRVRACEILEIAAIPYIRITYLDEELGGDYPKDVKDLIESNLKQRVSGNNNPIKLGKCLKFLEGYYGIHHGNNQISGTSNNYKSSKTQKELAEEYNMSIPSYHNYKKLADAIPEIEELITTGVITSTTALAIMRQLPQDQQKKIAGELIADGTHISQRQAEEKIKKLQEESNLKNSQIKEMESKIAALESVNSYNQSDASSNEVEYLRSELATYKKEVEILRNRSTSAEGRDANVAYTFWQATKTYIDTVLAPMLYDDLITNNQDNSCSSHIIDACTKVIYAAEDVLKRFKASTIIDVE